MERCRLLRAFDRPQPPRTARKLRFLPCQRTGGLRGSIAQPPIRSGCRGRQRHFRGLYGYEQHPTDTPHKDRVPRYAPRPRRYGRAAGVLRHPPRTIPAIYVGASSGENPTGGKPHIPRPANILHRDRAILLLRRSMRLLSDSDRHLHRFTIQWLP